MAVMRRQSLSARNTNHPIHRSLETGIRENGENTRYVFDLRRKVSQNIRKTTYKYSHLGAEREIPSEYVEDFDLVNWAPRKSIMRSDHHAGLYS